MARARRIERPPEWAGQEVASVVAVWRQGLRLRIGKSAHIVKPPGEILQFGAGGDHVTVKAPAHFGGQRFGHDGLANAWLALQQQGAACGQRDLDCEFSVGLPAIDNVLATARGEGGQAVRVVFHGSRLEGGGGCRRRRGRVWGHVCLLRAEHCLLSM